MSGEWDPEANVILASAVEIESPQQRAAYLDEACSGNQKLRERVDRLLGALQQAGDFLENAPEVTDILGNPCETMAEGVGTRIGPYKLLQQIGEGGFGVVYMADQTEPVRRKVALKIIKPGMDTKEVVARFEAERQALALMDHPNIAKVFDGGATNTGRPYFVMELVKGVSLTDYCDEKKLDTHKRLELFTSVCKAIQHAHHKGVIHRDIKPSNVMITLHDGEPVPKVIDFGISKAIAQQLTEKTMFTAYGQLIGTPQYMSPEQAEMSGLDIDTRSDIYSLGVLLYELLTGSTPLEAKSLGGIAFIELQRLIREVEPPRPSTKLSTVSEATVSIAAQRGTDPKKLGALIRGELDCIVMKAVEKNRERRYESASAMAADVQRFLAGLPIEARPASAWYRFSKLAQRNKVALATAALVGLALIVGSIVSTWQAVRATNAETAARENYENEQTAHRATNRAENQAIKERDRAVAARNQAERYRQAAEDEREEKRRQLYLADMNLAQQAYDAGNIARTNELLFEYWPQPGMVDADLRDFEWYYLWRAGHLYRDRILPHGWPIRRMIGSADGKLLVHSFDNGALFLRDAADGRLLHNLGGQGEACFSHDGTLVAIGASSGKISILKTTDGSTVTTFQSNQPAGSNWLASTLYNLSGLAVAFSPDDEYLASGDQEGKIIVWKLNQNIGAGPNVSFRELPKSGSRVRSLFYTPDGTLLSGLEDGSVILWDVENSRILATRRTHKQLVSCVRASRNGLLASGSDDGTVQLWNSELESLGELSAFGPVVSLAFSPDGKYLAAGTSKTNSVIVWSIDSSPPTQVHTIRGHSRQIHGVAFGEDSKTLWTASEDQYLKVWNLARCEPVQTLNRVATESKVSYAADGRVLFLNDQGSMQAWSIATRSSNGLLDADRKYLKIAVSANGKVVTGVARDGKLEVWDLNNETLLSTRSVASDNVDGIAVDRDGRAVSWSESDRTTVLDLQTGREALVPVSGKKHILSSNGEQLVVQRTIQRTNPFVTEIWDTTADPPRRAHSLDGYGPENCAALSLDEKLLAIGSWNNQIRVYDFVTGEQKQTLKGHTGQVRCVAFSTDANLLVSGGTDKTVRIWSPHTGRLRATLNGHQGSVESVAFSPSGDSVASSSLDGTIKIWVIATQEEVEENLEARMDAATYYQSQMQFERAIAAATYVIQQDPDNVEALTIRSRLNFAARRWSNTAADYRKLAELNPDGLELWLQTASLYVQAGDIDGYHRFCREMLNRFSATDQALEAEKVAKACLIVAPEASALDEAIALADKAVSLPNCPDWGIPHVTFVRGLADYRMENFKAAQNRSRETLALLAEKRNILYAQASLLLAMSSRQLDEDPRKAFEEAEKILSNQPAGQALIPSALWHDWLICQSLHHEANELIHGNSAK